MSDEAARMARAEQASAALTAFLSPAFDVARADYMAKLTELLTRPMCGDNLKACEKLALAVKVANEVEAQIEALVADGQMARADASRAADIARLPAEQRRYAQYAPA
jgi:hypothetical protein